MKLLHMLPVLAILFSVSASRASTWNAAADFSAAANPNGVWTYGYYLLNGYLGLDLPSEPVTFQELTRSSEGSDYISWFTPSEISVLNISSFKDQGNLILVAGLAPATAFYAPVVRWTAPNSGQYLIKADFEYSGMGAAITSTSQAGLRIDDVTLAYSYIGGSDGELRIDQGLYLSAGQTLNFFVARGQHAISLTSNISAVPEPSSYLLFAIGVVVFWRCLPTIRSRLPVDTVLRQYDI